MAAVWIDALDVGGRLKQGRFQVFRLRRIQVSAFAFLTPDTRHLNLTVLIMKLSIIHI